MTFYPSIQSLIGNQVPPSDNCTVDWIRNRMFTLGNAPDTNAYLSSVNVLTGVQIAYELVYGSAYVTPAGSGHANGLSGQPPLCVDAAGNVYQTWFSYDGGGLVQCDGTSLAQLQVGGTTGLPPGGFVLTGCLSALLVGTTQFVIGLGQGGSFGSFIDDEAVFNQVTFAGRFEEFGQPFVGTPHAISCAGKIGGSVGFIVVGPGSSSDTQHLILQTVTCVPGGSWTISQWPTQNSNITITTLATFVPTDINGAWSEIYPVGMCIDQTDGNILLWAQNSTSVGVGVTAAMVKVNATTGAIIWNATVPAASQVYSITFQFSSILHQQLAIISGNVNCTVTTIDTSDGSTASTMTGFSGLAPASWQAYNDTLGAILLNTQYFTESNAPTQIGTTPSSFSGWAMLYATPAFVPPTPVVRRLVAELGPVRIQT